MPRSRVALLGLMAIAVSSCAIGATNTPGGAASGSGEKVTVDNSPFGKAMVLASGQSIYTPAVQGFACSVSCAATFHPITAKHIVAAVGVSSSFLGTKSGQLLVGGHPAYIYSGDTLPFEVSGEGLTKDGTKWYLISPKGDLVIGKAGASGSVIKLG